MLIRSIRRSNIIPPDQILIPLIGGGGGALGVNNQV